MWGSLELAMVGEGEGLNDGGGDGDDGCCGGWV